MIAVDWEKVVTLAVSTSPLLAVIASIIVALIQRGKKSTRLAEPAPRVGELVDEEDFASEAIEAYKDLARTWRSRYVTEHKLREVLEERLKRSDERALSLEAQLEELETRRAGGSASTED